MQNETRGSTPSTGVVDDHARSGLQALAADLERLYASPIVDAAFAARLRRRLEGEAATAQAAAPLTPRRSRPLRRRAFAGGAAAAVLALLVFGGMLISDRGSEPVSAQEILSRAQTVAASAAPVGVSSYHQTAASTNRGNGTTVTGTTETWYGGRGRFRIERQTRDASGAVASASGDIANGNQTWRYVTERGQTRVETGTTPGGAIDTDEKFLPNSAASSLSDLLNVYRDSGCGAATARQQGEATVAGRAAYIIEVTGGTDCGGRPGQPRIARSVIAVDKETYFALKTESYTSDGTLLARYETTSIEYNITIPEGTFTYTPPPGAVVGGPTPAGQQGRTQPVPANVAPDCWKREVAAGRQASAEASCRTGPAGTAVPAGTGASAP
jgi:outer membrane lipoprotein-sorting protein